MTDEIKSLEHSTLKVPYETLNKQYRNVQKAIDRDCSSMTQYLNQIDKLLVKNEFTKGELAKYLTNLVEKLKNLKRRSQDLRNEEKDLLKLIKRRIEHLKECESPVQNAVKLYRRQRVDRMLIDYFLRFGYYETAQELATKSNLQDMTNVDIFLIEKDIIDSLKSHDTSKCITWCNEHKSKLKKVNSNLEFMLRQQEFIELVRAQKCIDAVHHARKHFVNLTSQQLVDVQKSMVLLAYVKSSDSAIYQELLSESRWDFLINTFKSDNYKIHQLPQQSCFNAVLQAGLSALKTPTCFRKVQSIKNPNCPVCQPSLNTLAKQLPYAHCSNSKLICASNGEPLNENNLPMMLPNGFVYGHNTLLEIMEKNNGKIKCPRTSDCFDYSELNKKNTHAQSYPLIKRCVSVNPKNPNETDLEFFTRLRIKIKYIMDRLKRILKSYKLTLSERKTDSNTNDSNCHPDKDAFSSDFHRLSMTKITMTQKTL